MLIEPASVDELVREFKEEERDALDDGGDGED